MYRIPLSFFIFIACLVSNMFGQSSEEIPFLIQAESPQPKDFKYSAKLAGGFILRHEEYIYVSASNTFVLDPSQRPGFKWDRFRWEFQVQPKAGQIHEFTFMPKFSIPTVVNPVFNGQESSIFYAREFAFGYGYFSELLKQKDLHGFAFYLGFQANPYYRLAKFKPLGTSAFDDRNRLFGIQGKIVPRVAWYSSKRFFADLSFELTAFNAYVGEYSSSNPTIPLAYRKQVRSNFTLLPSMHSVVAAVGIKL